MITLLRLEIAQLWFQKTENKQVKTKACMGKSKATQDQDVKPQALLSA
jgi:hypothetical protein